MLGRIWEDFRENVLGWSFCHTGIIGLADAFRNENLILFELTIDPSNQSLHRLGPDISRRSRKKMNLNSQMEPRIDVLLFAS